MACVSASPPRARSATPSSATASGLRAAAEKAFEAQSGRPCDIVVVARPETLTADFDMLVSELAVAVERARPQGQGRRPRPAPGPAAGKTRGKGGDRPPGPQND